MELKASQLCAGHVIPDGSWGNYTVLNVEQGDNGYVRVNTKQGSVKRVFLFHKDQTVWLG